MLTPQTRARWKSRIGGGQPGNLFFRNWIFVDRVNLTTDSVTFHFNLPGKFYDPVYAKVVIYESMTGAEYIWENPNYVMSERLEISIGNLLRTEMYVVTLFLDDQVMYSNEYNVLNLGLPF